MKQPASMARPSESGGRPSMFLAATSWHCVHPPSPTVSTHWDAASHVGDVGGAVAHLRVLRQRGRAVEAGGLVPHDAAVEDGAPAVGGAAPGAEARRGGRRRSTRRSPLPRRTGGTTPWRTPARRRVAPPPPPPLDDRLARSTAKVSLTAARKARVVGWQGQGRKRAVYTTDWTRYKSEKSTSSDATAFFFFFFPSLSALACSGS